MLRLGDQRWELHRGSHCSDCEPIFGLQDGFWARQWLWHLKESAASVRTLRNLFAREGIAGKVSGMSDDEVIAHMAKLLSDGFWHVHPLPLWVGGGGTGPGLPGGEEAPEPRRAPSRSDAPSAAPEEEGLPESADQAAIAAVLKDASDQGIPFCEECARLAAQQSAQGGGSA